MSFLSLDFQSKWSLTNCHEAEWQGFLFLASATSQSNKFQVFITLPCKAEWPSLSLNDFLGRKGPCSNHQLHVLALALAYPQLRWRTPSQDGVPFWAHDEAVVASA